MKILTVNPGSTSKKYAFFEDDVLNAFFHLEKTPGGYSLHIKAGDLEGNYDISQSEYEMPHEHIFDVLYEKKLLASLDQLDAIGVRVVAPGEFFLQNRTMSTEYLDELSRASTIAPLHIFPVKKEIDDLCKHIDIKKICGISDSSFHVTKSDVAKYYAINRHDSDTYGIYKFGYHGLSLQSILHTLSNDLSHSHHKMIICHLGGGASVTAVIDGKSVDTSMGFSPLEGITMATRVGDIDPAVVLQLGKVTGKSNEELEYYFNHECGLYGLSNRKSDDIRKLLELEKDGDADAALALHDFVYNIKKYIGAYAAVLNGIDSLVFSGTIGVRSIPIRTRILQDLNFLGVRIDEQKNNDAFEKNAFIHADDSAVKVATVITDEQHELMRQTKKVVLRT